MTCADNPSKVSFCQSQRRASAMGFASHFATAPVSRLDGTPTAIRTCSHAPAFFPNPSLNQGLRPTHKPSLMPQALRKPFLSSPQTPAASASQSWTWRLPKDPSWVPYVLTMPSQSRHPFPQHSGFSSPRTTDPRKATSSPWNILPHIKPSRKFPFSLYLSVKTLLLL